MKKFAALFALLLAALALVACGSDSDTEETTPPKGVQETEKTEGAGGGGSAELHFEADPSGALAFTTDSATAKAGKVEVHFANPSSVPHDVVIEDEGGETVAQTETLAEGEDSTTANLKPGEYTFYCSVPGHRDAGMEGTLTVE